MLIRLIKKLFGIYEAGYEYWVPTDQIIITPDFARTRIGTRKWIVYDTLNLPKKSVRIP